MKHYLVNGYLEFADKPFRCILGGRAVLEDHEIMDHATLRKVEAILLAEQLELRKAGKGVAAWATPCGFKVTGFQPFETQAVAQPAAEPHLNECSVVLPPVDSLLLIEIAPGVLVKATRPAHAPSRDDYLQFNIEGNTDGWYTGRPRWTHP